MFLKNEHIISGVSSHIIDYPTPSNLRYIWSFGFLAGMFLVIQIITGIFLVMQYNSEMNNAFNSVEHIMRDLMYGWLLRYMHANGASFYFFILYLHILRGVIFKSYQERPFVWYSGIIIFFLSMATAFLGYVLPMGQMSLWGATVITNMLSAIPYIGNSLVIWVWGAFLVDSPTIPRFFSFHYLLPFLIVIIICTHIYLLHIKGSSTPAFSFSKNTNITFTPYFFEKDTVFFIFIILIFCYYIAFLPDVLGHSDNYIEANNMVTPPHIVPEWYFLPFYAMLRSVPSKLGGVIVMLSAIIILAILPYIDRSKFGYNRKFDLTYYIRLYILAQFILLGMFGSMPATPLVVSNCLLCTTMYFYAFFFIYMVSEFEDYINIPTLIVKVQKLVYIIKRKFIKEKEFIDFKFVNSIIL